MTTSPIRWLARTAWASAVVAFAALTGCASPDPGPAAMDKLKETSAGPAAPSRTLTNFAAELRCMDNLLLDHGTRDLTVIAEDLADPPNKVSAGTMDMLASAVSEMTRRSRAIRLVAYSPDSGSLLQAIKREPLAVAPQYVLRGSIRHGASLSELGIDLTLLTTQDLSVVPGTASRNTAILSKPGNGVDGETEIRKFGIDFRLPTGTREGQARALRALVDLSSIELFGRLAKVPYWSCLGATERDEAVAAEIRDWYDAMAAHPSEIIGYFQLQLRARRIYDGPVDGVVNPPFKEAVARYREALGLSREPKLSLDFFKAYLGADHHPLEARVQRVPAAATPPATASAAPLALRVAAANNARRFALGEAVQLTVRPSRDAHVYCFLQDENRQISRFFPNRFQRDSRVDPAKGLQLPGAMRFEIRMNPRGVQETVSCFATERDVLPELPPGLSGGDFDPLPVKTLEQLRSAFVNVAGAALAQESFHVQPK